MGDWGLTLKDFRPAATQPAPQETSLSNRSQQPAAAPAAGQKLQRQFSARIYRMAVAFDLLLRLSWVLTLFPNSSVNRAVLQTLVSTAEIFRRAMWTVFR